MADKEYFLDEKCCGNCTWCYYGYSTGFICCNGNAERLADFVNGDDCCELWEDRLIGNQRDSDK